MLPFTFTLVAIAEFPLDGDWASGHLAGFVQFVVVELVECGLLVAGFGRGLVDVRHLEQGNEAAVLHRELVHEAVGTALVTVRVVGVLVHVGRVLATILNLVRDIVHVREVTWNKKNVFITLKCLNV